MILQRSFYNHPTLEVAKQLLGCVLVRKIAGQEIRAVITETEAYVGEDDLASHASKGRTPRTELMYGQPGFTYVYMIYGMYHCLNVVTEKKDFPAAVLIRSAKIEGVDYKKTNGPGKLCKVLQIDRKLNGLDITKGEKLWIEPADVEAMAGQEIQAGKRIGVEYAGRSKEHLWRFSLAGRE
jgi:DNA-3-methyladenine glycosylase